jgi:hypothetical protein
MRVTYMLKINGDEVRSSLRSTALVAAVLVGISFGFHDELAASKLGVLAWCMLLSMTAATLFKLVHILTLVFLLESYLLFDDHGVTDQMSFLRLGLIKNRELRKIRFAKRLGYGRCLEIRVRNSAECWETRSMVQSRADGLYRFFFANNIFVPVKWIAASSDDIKKIILSFKEPALLTEPDESADVKTTVINTQTPRIVMESPPREVEEVLVEDSSDTPPPIVQFHHSEPEPEPQNEVAPRSANSNRKISEKMLLMYSECFRHFPRWLLEHDPRLPAGVREVHSVTTLAEDRLQFQWSESQFACVMMPQPDDSSLLIFSVNEKEHLKLKIQLEIGTYELLETLVFIDGKWIEHLEALGEAAQPQAIKRAN